MSTLKLKLNVNLPPLLSVVVSEPQNGEFGRFGGFPLTVTSSYKRRTLSS